MARRITVVGAGIFGLACGWELARRGVAVTVIERAAIGNGSSGGTVGALAPHAPENWNDKKQMQLDALVAAQGWWAEVAAAGGVDPGYARSGRIQPVDDPAEIPRLRQRIAAAAGVWPAPFGMALTDAPQGPLVPESRVGLWLTDNLSARIAPRAACAALAAAIRAAGGAIVENAALPGPDADPAPGRAPQDPVIWATGAAGLAALSADLGRAVGSGVKGQSALLAFDAPGAAQVYAGGLHIVAHGDGSVGIGSTTEREAPDPAAGSGPATDAQLDALIDTARRVCPALAHAPVIDRWAGMRPRAGTRAPVLGPWPGRPGHFVANGGFKIGFGIAPAVGAMLAALVTDGHDTIPADFRLKG